MRNIKALCLSVILLMSISSAVLAGQLTLGAKAYIYNPPEEGASPSLMYGFVLDYDMNRYLHAMAEASYTSYAAKGINYTLMPITLNLVAHFLPGSPVDPYLGGGVGYYSKTADGVENSKTGWQTMAGVTFRVGNFYAGFEATYIVPDMSQSTGSVAWGGWASGTTSVFVPF